MKSDFINQGIEYFVGGFCVITNGVYTKAVLLKFPHGFINGSILGLTTWHQDNEDLVTENNLSLICLDNGGCPKGINRCQLVRAKFENK